MAKTSTSQQYGGVKLDGARNLRATLRRAGADMSQMSEVHRHIGGIIAGAADSRAPRRPDSGRLAATIRPGATRAAAIVRAGNNRKTGVPYANPIHWGWFKRHIRPNPFLSLAAQQTEPRWFAYYSKAIEKILDRIKGK